MIIKIDWIILGFEWKKTGCTIKYARTPNNIGRIRLV